MEEQTTRNDVIETIVIGDDDDEPLQNEESKHDEGSEVAEAEEQNPIMIDLKRKMDIIYEISKACHEEKNQNVYYSFDNILLKLAYITNLPNPVLSEIINQTKEPIKTYTLEESVIETPDIDFLIRQTLITYYIKSQKIPKNESLIHITSELGMQLKRSGYIWRCLPNTNRAIIMEHPKRLIQRQRYLKKMFDKRKEHRPIVYIEAKILTRADKDIHHFQTFLNEDVNFVIVFIAVNNNTGFIAVHIFVSDSFFKCQKIIEDCVIHNVLPCLSQPSVIVLEDNPFYRKTLPVPSIESEKYEMIHWLKMNRLLFEKNLHRSELFELIQKCKQKSDLHDFDALLRSNGHEILRRPSRTHYLNYYKPLWTNITTNEAFTVFISKKNPDYWKNLESFIISMEKSVFSEDLEMDNITDKILTMAINTDVAEWADDECDEEEDSLAQEEFITPVKNSFSPVELQLYDHQFLDEVNKIIISTFSSLM